MIAFDSLVPGLDVTVSALREAMGDTAFLSARDAGAALSYQAAGELARELIARARVALASDG